jgi:RNA polymerase sigma-70 factor (ECF subfamily)
MVRLMPRGRPQLVLLITQLPPYTSNPVAAPRTAGPSDDTLVRRFLAGDESGATELFDRYMPRVRSLAQARCAAAYAGRFDADDIVQSVFQTFFAGLRAETYMVPPEGEL